MDSQQNHGLVETGAAMDYAEHERTYDGFLAAAKWGTLHVVALLVAMAAGFFGGVGLLGGIVIFLVLSIAGVFILR